MPAPLLALVRAAAAPGGVPALAIGLDSAPAGSAVRGVPVAAAMGLLAVARQHDRLDRAAVAEALGLDLDAVAGAALVLPGRRTGWTTVEGAELAVALAAAVPRIALASPPSGSTSNPTQLGDLVRSKGGEPSLLGSLPPGDDLAPGCPVAILEADWRPVEPPTVAALVVAERPTAMLRHTLRALAEEGIHTVVIAEPGDPDFEAPMSAVVEAREPGESVGAAVARIAARQPADWILAFAADERPIGPWPQLGLRETVARFAGSGWDAASATVVLHPSPADDPGFDPLRLAREWRFATGRSDAGRIILWRRELDPSALSREVRRSPWNLLLRRVGDGEHAGGTAAARLRHGDGWATAPNPGGRAWLPWDDGFGEHYLVERLTGHGTFRRSFPTPPACVFSTDERAIDWGGSTFSARLATLPVPEPLDPRPGVVRLRWDVPDGRSASLFLTRPDQPERLIARQPSGAVTIDLLEPNAACYARLYEDDDRRQLLAELRFGFVMDLDE